MQSPIRIIPCLDISSGRVVKGRQFQNLVDLGNPIDLAVRYFNAGADELILLDILASREKRTSNGFLTLIKEVSSRVSIPVVAGGGINSVQKVSDLLNAGADKVSINSNAAADGTLLPNIVRTYGTQCVVAALDVAKNNHKNQWLVYTFSGSLPGTTEILDRIKRLEELGAGELLVTSIDKDGTKDGFDISLMKFITQSTKLPVIASGGAGNSIDCINILKEGRVEAVVVAGIIHSNAVSLKEIRKAIASSGIRSR